MNNMALKKAWEIKWKKAKTGLPIPKIIIIIPSCLRVDKAITFFISISTIAVYLWLWCWADHSFNEQLINFWIRYIFSLGHQLVQFPASFTHRHDFVTQQVATRHVSVAVSDTNAIALCSFTGSGTTCNSKSQNVSIFASMLSAYLPNWNIL